MDIFLITKSGPEWQAPIEAWTTKREAERRAKELDTQLNPKDVYDSLSGHEVVRIPLKGGQP